MSRLPTITDPRYAPGEVSLHLTGISAPQLGLTPGLALARVSEQLAEKGISIVQAVRAARRRRVVADFDTDGMTTAAQALDAARNAPDGQDQVAFDQTFANLEGRIREEEDAETRDEALQRFRHTYGATKILAGRQRVAMEERRFGESLANRGKAYLDGVEAGTIGPDAAVSGFRDLAQSGVGIHYMQEDADLRVEEFDRAVDQAMSSGRQAALVGLSAQTSSAWAQAATDAERNDLESLFRSELDEAVSVNAITQEEAERRFFGMKSAAVGHVDDEVRSIVRQAKDYAKLGEPESIDRLRTRLEQLPATNEQQAALVEFRTLGVSSLTVQDAAMQYVTAIQAGTWPDNPPQDSDSINAAQNHLLRVGMTPAAVASVFLKNGSVIEHDLNQQIVSLMDHGDPRFNLGYAAEVLRAIADVDPKQAENIAFNNAKAPVVGRALWYALTEQSSFSLADTQKLLGNADAVRLLSESGPVIEPSKMEDRKATFKAIVDALGANPDSQMYAQIISDARLHYLSLVIDQRDNSSVPERGMAAIERAAESVAGRTTRVDTFPGQQWPREFGESYLVDSKRLPSNFKAFEAAIGANYFRSPFSFRRQHLHPDMIMQRGTLYYVPAIEGQVIGAIFQFDDATGESEMIQPADERYKPLADEFFKRDEVEDFDSLSYLRWYSGYSSKYVIEQDALGGSHLWDQLYRDVATGLSASGLLRNMTPQQQQDQVGRAMTIEAVRRGWQGLDPPKKAESP